MNTPTMAAVLDAAIVARQYGVRVSLPGRVEAYNADRQSVDVQPLIADGYVDEQKQRQARVLPVLVNVPLMFLGSGAYRDTFPIEVGSTVLLLFSSSSIDRWLAVGGAVDPGDDRRHSLNDAIAIPGLHDFAHVPTTAPTDARVMHAPKIRLGSPNADDPVVRRSDLEAALADLNDRYKTHKHITPSGLSNGPQDGVTAAPITDVSTPVCSTKVFTE